MEPPNGHIPGVHLPGTLILRQQHEEALRQQGSLTQQAAAEAEVQQLRELDRLTQRLIVATDLDEITRVLEASTSTPRYAWQKTTVDLGWRAAVGVTWRRLSQAGTFGPPSHDIVTVHCRWPVHGKPQRLTFEELSRQPAWLVLDAQPYVRRGPDRREETRGTMDV